MHTAEIQKAHKRLELTSIDRYSSYRFTYDISSDINSTDISQMSIQKVALMRDAGNHECPPQVPTLMEAMICGDG